MKIILGAFSLAIPNNAAQAVKEVSKAIAAVTCPPPAEAPVIAKKPRPALKLSGIMAGPTGEVALINGRMVRVGESIEGVTLESIENQTANLSFEGETFSLGL
jgi:type II secretory pathway component PulC